MNWLHAKNARTRWVVVITQVTLAFVLLWWSYVTEDHATHLCDMPGPDPAWQLVTGLNAPVMLLRATWLLVLENFQIGSLTGRLLEAGSFLIAVACLWYGVMVNADALRHRTSSWTPSRLGSRLLWDLLLVIIGVVLGLAGLGKLIQLGPIPSGAVACFGFSSMKWFWWFPRLLEACLYSAWSLVLMFFLGRDVFRVLRPKGGTSPNG